MRVIVSKLLASGGVALSHRTVEQTISKVYNPIVPSNVFLVS